MNQELIKSIQEKKAKLENIKIELKTEFFGIDYQIDKVIDSIKTWYIMPSIITKPLIINLWGLTGVGKTAFVRSLVDKLEFRDRFLEMQLSDTVDAESILIKILNSGIKEDKPGIILFDEFQRYRTIDPFEADIKDLSYQDIWMLLSDGKFPPAISKTAKAIDHIDSLSYRIIQEKITNTDEETGIATVKSLIKKENIPHDEPFTETFGDSNPYQLQNYFDNTISATQIQKHTKGEMIEMVKTYAEKRKKEYDFVKCLIFISGNLDEAFQMASDVEDCDTNADIYHEYTKNITVINIKEALMTRFKPEQISRLGNNHIIYPSLNTDSYRKIIKKTCDSYTKDSYDLFGLTFNIDESVIDEIYENSVYPTQGTRPVFSSIHKMFGSPLSNGILWALENDYKNINIRIDSKNSCLNFSSDNSSLCTPIDFDIRDRKNKYSKDFSALVAIHEVGHSILYADLLKEPPVEVRINAASFTGGYNLRSNKTNNKQSLLDSVCICFGGIVAEEIIFGESLRSEGCSSDISKATNTAAKLVRKLAMGQTNGYNIYNESYTGITDYTETDKNIENILLKEKQRALKIIKSHQLFLIKCAKKLLEVSKLSKNEFKEFAKDEFVFDDTISHDIFGSYAKILDSK